MQIDANYCIQYCFISKYTNGICKQFIHVVLQTSCTSTQCCRIVLFHESLSPMLPEGTILDCSARCQL